MSKDFLFIRGKPHIVVNGLQKFETLSVSVHGLELEIPCQSIYSASKPLHGDQRRSKFLGLYEIETKGWKSKFI